jgi:hypothetical protein
VRRLWELIARRLYGADAKALGCKGAVAVLDAGLAVVSQEVLDEALGLTPVLVA